MTASPVETLTEGVLCRDALRIFRKERLRRAPVMREGRLVGMVTEHDLLGGLPRTIGDLEDDLGETSETMKVGDVMSQSVIHVAPTDHLEDAAKLMLRHKVGGMPVLKDGKLVGIITESDLFRAFVNIASAGHGLRVTLKQGPHAKSAPRRRALEVCIELGLDVQWFASYPSPGGETIVVLHVEGERADELPERLVDHGYLAIDVERDGPGQAKASA